MKANEARRIAEAANTGKLQEVYDAIKKAAECGDLRTHVYFLLDQRDRSALLKDGYYVFDVSERNETCFCISWNPEDQKKLKNIS